MSGCEEDGLIEVCEGFFSESEGEEEVAAEVVEFGIFGLEANGGAEVGTGIGIFSNQGVDVSAHAKQRGVVGSDADGLTEGFDGGGMPSLGDSSICTLEQRTNFRWPVSEGFFGCGVWLRAGNGKWYRGFICVGLRFG